MENKRALQKNKLNQLKSMALVLAILFTLTTGQKAKGQTLEAGAFGGAAYYLGDLNPQKHFIESDLAYGGLLKYNLNQRLGISLSFTQANIKSDAADYNADHTASPAANLSTQINDLSLMGEINFFPYSIGDRDNIWTPYIMGGGAAFISNNTTSFAVPFGLGLKVSPFKRIGLNLFWSARKTFTDELDNVISIDYNGYNKDWYFMYGLNLTFAFRLKKDNSCRNLINGQYY